MYLVKVPAGLVALAILMVLFQNCGRSMDMSMLEPMPITKTFTQGAVDFSVTDNLSEPLSPSNLQEQFNLYFTETDQTDELSFCIEQYNDSKELLSEPCLLNETKVDEYAFRPISAETGWFITSSGESQSVYRLPFGWEVLEQAKGYELVLFMLNGANELSRISLNIANKCYNRPAGASEVVYVNDVDDCRYKSLVIKNDGSFVMQAGESLKLELATLELTNKGQLRLVDRNIILYRTVENCADCTPHLIFQSDGNLVIYKSSERTPANVLFQSNTKGTGLDFELDSKNIVIRGATSKVWAPTSQ